MILSLIKDVSEKLQSFCFFSILYLWKLKFISARQHIAYMLSTLYAIAVRLSIRHMGGSSRNSKGAGASHKGGVGKISHLLALSVNISFGQEQEGILP